MNRRALPAITTLLIIACHSDSFAPANYGAIGPRNPGSEIMIDSVGANPIWSDDGAGILYAGRCLTIHQPRFATDRTIGAIDMQPAVSGSIMWSHCESRPAFVLRSDSTEKFTAMALGSDGRLLYVEAIGSSTDSIPFRVPCLCEPFPVGWHADLWVTDTVPASAPRRLVTLYHDSLGISTSAPGEVNWLTDAHWIGETDFVAMGENLDAMGNLVTIGVVRGSTTGSTVHVITGTAGAQRYSPAENNASIIFTRDGATLERVGAGGGSPTALVQIGDITDISCQGEICLVLAGRKFWGVNLATGTAIAIASDSRGFSTARLSPTSNSVVAGVSGGPIYLLTDIIH
jgi:hypothetical protein